MGSKTFSLALSVWAPTWMAPSGDFPEPELPSLKDTDLLQASGGRNWMKLGMNMIYRSKGFF